MDNISVFGNVQLLRRRNLGVVIRDESELNIIQIEADERNNIASSFDKGKGKGKENRCSNFEDQGKRKGKEKQAPDVEPYEKILSKAALAQRRRRERERNEREVIDKTEQVIQSKRRTIFPGLPPSGRSRGSSVREAKKARVAQIPPFETPNVVDRSLHRITPITNSLPNNQVPDHLHPIILPRNLNHDFDVFDFTKMPLEPHINNNHCVAETSRQTLACSFVTSSMTATQQQLPDQVDHIIADPQIPVIIEDNLQAPIEENFHILLNQDVAPENNRAHGVDLGRHFLGMMNVECPYCSALHWMDEKLSKSSSVHPRFGKCCLQGQIRLPTLNEPPPEIKYLYDGNDDQCRSFRRFTREYNAANAFTSLGVQMDDRVLTGWGPAPFTIHGELRHRTGALLPEHGQERRYAQLYVYHPDSALDTRERRNPRLRRDVLGTIQDCLLVNNAFTSKFRQAFAILDQVNSASQNIPAYLHYSKATDRRRYNLPSADEIAVILPGDGTQLSAMRDIIIRLKGDNQLMRISECHPAYLPLHYVLLFPRGELGWEPDMKLWDVVNGRYWNSGHRLTQLNYYGFRLFQRVNEYSTILRAGKLFQEFIVDAWASTEQNRLTYYKLNQGKLRVELYKGLTEGFVDGYGADEIGKRTVLPSSFTGSARHMFEIFQDSMAITRFNQHPDIFLTMTANPNWPEIKAALLPNQNALDRPDLVARVFELKRNALMKEIEKKNVFGRKVAHVFTIEFQKRGLPHMHTLLFLESQSKIKTCAQVDNIVCAEFPDPKEDPALFETILGCMVHGPCGTQNPQAPCMENGRCTKKYPRAFSESTTMDQHGYPIYRRRDDGQKYTVGRGKEVDNRHVVPYNPYLSRMFNCHINVEVCAGLRCVKYINKYIYKGHDRTTMVLGGVDEIQQYLDARYIGPPEAAWRIFGNPLHEEFPSVVRLALHLPGMHHVMFNPKESMDTIIARAEVQRTTLTEFFAMCASNESARAFTYQEFPQHFVWHKTQKVWTPRSQGTAIGRMYFVGPNSGDIFYLRLLLTVVKGPPSYEALKTVNNVSHDSFKSACVAMGLLEDDDEWVQCLQEAAIMKSGYQLRRLFVVILTQCAPLHPNLLWNQFAIHICDDLGHKIRTLFGIQNPTEIEIEDYGLYLLNQLLQESGKSLTDFPPMPQSGGNWSTTVGNRLICEHRQLQSDAEQADAQSNVDRLNDGQRAAYTSITTSVFESKGITFFLNGGAGTGKTFLYNTIATKCRSLGHIVITVASSGIASLLLVGGRTAHSTFCIPLDILENSICGFTKQSIHADLFKKTKLIIWDEVPMQHRHCVEAVDRTLQDICNNKKSFGGITVVLGGDFRQILPVIPKGLREQIVSATLRRSELWRDIHVLTLDINMRLNNLETESAQFSNFLIEIGSSPQEFVQLPSTIRKCNNLNELMSAVYPELNVEGTVTPSYLNERTILSARNDDVATINSSALNIFPGDAITYFAADKLCVDENDSALTNQYPNEFLNSLNPSGLPLFKLEVKVGCPIMLLRNIAPKDGLCNGTRLIVVRCAKHVIEVKILTGDKHGNFAFIPRISLTPSSSELPIQMTRRQFPVKLAYAMTMNKSQGQSVKFVGIDLRTPVFSHGQLYVALSRCTSADRISILLPNDGLYSTTNIVYPEVLL